MAKQRIHKFIITVVMDRKCLRRTALHEVRDNIHGEFYCSPMELDAGEPESFRVRSITAPQGRVR